MNIISHPPEFPEWAFEEPALTPLEEVEDFHDWIMLAASLVEPSPESLGWRRID